jgi:hypothetical protein
VDVRVVRMPLRDDREEVAGGGGQDLERVGEAVGVRGEAAAPPGVGAVARLADAGVAEVGVGQRDLPQPGKQTAQVGRGHDVERQGHPHGGAHPAAMDDDLLLV